MIQIEHFTFNSFQERCCVVWDESGQCAFVDPGCSSASELAMITGFVADKGLTPACIMLTHSHFDHIFGVASLVAAFGGALPVYMHPSEGVTLENNEYLCRCFGLPVPDGFETADVVEGSVVKVGSLKFEVMETPGHTAGGVCYLERSEKVLFSGDTLFAGAIGRTDHPGGDYDKIIRSILDKLVPLDGDITVIPGHGPCSDIATEGMTNPFLRPFDEELQCLPVNELPED